MKVIDYGSATGVFNDPLFFPRGYLEGIYYFRTDCSIVLSDNVLTVQQADIDLSIVTTFRAGMFAANTGCYSLDYFVDNIVAFTTSNPSEPRFLPIYFQIGDAPTMRRFALRMAHLTPTPSGQTLLFPPMPSTYWLPS